MPPGLQLPRSRSLRRPIAALVIAMLTLSGLAAVWHPLHEWMHADTVGADDDCVVEMLAHGLAEAVTIVPIVASCGAFTWTEWLHPWRTVWVESLFGKSAVQEHAPPAVG